MDVSDNTDVLKQEIHKRDEVMMMMMQKMQGMESKIELLEKAQEAKKRDRTNSPLDESSWNLDQSKDFLKYISTKLRSTNGNDSNSSHQQTTTTQLLQQVFSMTKSLSDDEEHKVISESCESEELYDQFETAEFNQDREDKIRKMLGQLDEKLKDYDDNN